MIIHFGEFLSFATSELLPDFFKFKSICTLTTKATDDSRQFQWSNIVFDNKTKHYLRAYINEKLFFNSF